MCVSITANRTETNTKILRKERLGISSLAFNFHTLFLDIIVHEIGGHREWIARFYLRSPRESHDEYSRPNTHLSRYYNYAAHTLSRIT